jgi:hypothetical protein
MPGGGAVPFSWGAEPLVTSTSLSCSSAFLTWLGSVA